METIGVILGLIAFILFINVLIRAIKLMRKKEGVDKRGTLIRAGIAFAIFIIAAIVMPADDADKEAIAEEPAEEDSEEAKNPAEDIEEEVELIAEEKFAKVVNDTLGETTNTDQERIEDVIFHSYEDETVVNLTLNANENLTNKLTQGGILQDSADLLEAFAENKYEGDVMIMWKLPLTDSYGNVESGKVMSLTVEKETLEKINFDNFDYNKLPDIAESYDEHSGFSE